MHTVKAAIIVALVLLVGVFALQNTAVVDIRFFVWGFSLPRSLLVFVLLGIGFLLGLLAASLFTMRHR